MKQSEDSEAFFKKYGFTRSATQKHPVYGDEMHFEGLEADYVSSLESDLDHYKLLFREAMINNERFLHKEYCRMQDEIKKLKHVSDQGEPK